MGRNPIAVMLLTVVGLAACTGRSGGSRNSPVDVRVDTVISAGAASLVPDMTPDTTEAVEVSPTYVAGA